MKSLAGEDIRQISLSKAMKRCTRRPSVQQIPSSNANALYMSGGLFKIIKAGQQVSRRLHWAGVDVLYETSANLLAEPAPFFSPSFDQHLAPIAKSAAPGNCLVCLYGRSSSKCYSGLGEKKVEICFQHKKVPLGFVPDQSHRDTFRTFILLLYIAAALEWFHSQPQRDSVV